MIKLHAIDSRISANLPEPARILANNLDRTPIGKYVAGISCSEVIACRDMQRECDSRLSVIATNSVQSRLLAPTSEPMYQGPIRRPILTDSYRLFTDFSDFRASVLPSMLFTS